MATMKQTIFALTTTLKQIVICLKTALEDLCIGCHFTFKLSVTWGFLSHMPFHGWEFKREEQKGGLIGSICPPSYTRRAKAVKAFTAHHASYSE